MLFHGGLITLKYWENKTVRASVFVSPFINDPPHIRSNKNCNGLRPMPRSVFCLGSLEMYKITIDISELQKCHVFRVHSIALVQEKPHIAAVHFFVCFRFIKIYT